MLDFTLPIHDPVLIFAVVMLIVLLAPLLFNQLRVPGLVGLILCGALVGPSGIGLLERDSTMILLGTVGLLYLMFVAGLALDMGQFNRLRIRSIAFGLLSFLVPQLLGIATAIQVLGFSTPAALLLGSIVGSHTLLAYPIASRLGITKNKAVIMTMGGTIVTDTLALLLLAVVVASVEGQIGLAFWSRFLGLIALYLVAVLAGLPRLGRWFIRTTHGDPNIAFVFLVTALFVTAYLAEVAGLASIIGAFLAGLVLNRLVPEMGPLMSRVKFVGETLFIPFFLLSVGMLVDFSVLLGSLQVWGTALVLIALVLGGKGIAAGVISLIFRHTSAEAWSVFGLSVPQAAATLAVTLVGFNIGLFGEPMVNAVVVMILVTCMVGPWVVERFGRDVALQEEAAPTAPTDLPQRILIPLSNPATSDALVDFALAIRKELSEEALFPLAVVRGEGDVDAEVAEGEKLLSHAVIRAVAADAPVNPLTRVDMDVARGIARAVAERRISHVVSGWGGRPSPRQRIFGSVLDRVLDLTTTSVLVCRLSQPISTFQGIVLAVPPMAEREPGFADAIGTVKTLADRIGARLSLVMVARHQETVESFVSSTSPEVPISSVPVENYSRVHAGLADVMSEGALVILLSSRDTQRSWQPALDRLPRTFTHRFPGHDFIVLYPPVPSDEPASRPATQVSAEASPLPPLHTIRELSTRSLPSAVRELLSQPFPDRPDLVERISHAILRQRDYMLQELAPGIMLLHGHTHLVEEQMLFVGISDDGLHIEEAPSATNVILVLLNPASLPPERHLQTLGRLARAVHEVREAAGMDAAMEAEVLLRALST